MAPGGQPAAPGRPRPAPRGALPRPPLRAEGTESRGGLRPRWLGSTAGIGAAAFSPPPRPHPRLRRPRRYLRRRRAGGPGGPRRARLGGAVAGLHGRPAPPRLAANGRRRPPSHQSAVRSLPAPTNRPPPRAHDRRGLKGERQRRPRPPAGRFRGGGGGGTGAWRRFRWGRRGGTMNYMPGTASLIQDIDSECSAAPGPSGSGPAGDPPSPRVPSPVGRPVPPGRGVWTPCFSPGTCFPPRRGQRSRVGLQQQAFSLPLALLGQLPARHWLPHAVLGDATRHGGC